MKDAALEKYRRGDRSQATGEVGTPPSLLQGTGRYLFKVSY